MNLGKYYLSSLDSYALEPPRACTFIAAKRFASGKACMIARLDPPIPASAFGLARDVTEVVLSSRHEGCDLMRIHEFPFFVHVARALISDISSVGAVKVESLQHLAWGELYRSKTDAANHIFDAER